MKPSGKSQFSFSHVEVEAGKNLQSLFLPGNRIGKHRLIIDNQTAFV